MNLTDPDPSGGFLSALGSIASILGIGIASRSLQKERSKQLEASEASVREKCEELRKNVRNLSDEFEDYWYQIESICHNTQNDIPNTRFQSGIELLTTRQEFKTFCLNKSKIDQSVCQIQIGSNFILTEVANHNVNFANHFIDLIDPLQSGINCILVEGTDFEGAAKQITSMADQVSSHLRNLRGNR